MAHHLRVLASASADTRPSAQTPHAWLRVQPLAQLPYSLSKTLPTGRPRSEDQALGAYMFPTFNPAMVCSIPLRRLTSTSFSEFCERYLLFFCARSGGGPSGRHESPSTGSRLARPQASRYMGSPRAGAFSTTANGQGSHRSGITHRSYTMSGAINGYSPARRVAPVLESRPRLRHGLANEGVHLASHATRQRPQQPAEPPGHLTIVWDWLTGR